MVSFSLSQIIAFSLLVVAIAPGLIFLGRISIRVTHVEDNIKVIYGQLKDISTYVRNGRK